MVSMARYRIGLSDSQEFDLEETHDEVDDREIGYGLNGRVVRELPADLVSEYREALKREHDAYNRLVALLRETEAL
jgi:hypothetical protein